jgi:multicomponent Na+:H+ antiporter subunit E
MPMLAPDMQFSRTMSLARPRFPLKLLALAQRIAAYVALGWIVAEGDLSGWAVLLPILFAVATVDAVASNWRPWSFRPVAALRFTLFFFVQSVRGGVDVALRAVHPRLPIAPDIVQFSTRLSAGPARVLLANTVSLLPGTLAVQLEGETMQVHVLDSRLPVERTLRALESHIAELYGTGPGDRARDPC